MVEMELQRWWLEVLRRQLRWTLGGGIRAAFQERKEMQKTGVQEEEMDPSGERVPPRPVAEYGSWLGDCMHA